MGIAERAAIKEHARTRGIGAAQGLLGGLVAAAAERTRKQEERAEQAAQLKADVAASGKIGASLSAAEGYIARKEQEQAHKRDGKPNNPWRDVDPATADLTEAERLAQYKQSERYQAYQARMQAWQAEQ